MSKEHILFGKRKITTIKESSCFKNRNVLFCGASGTGKYYSGIFPNIRQMNGSFVIFDTGGYVYRELSEELVNAGYQIQVVDFSQQIESTANYNPFCYVKNIQDITPLINSIFDNCFCPDNKNSDTEMLEYEILTEAFYNVFNESEDQEKTLSDVFSVIQENCNFVQANSRCFEESGKRIYVALSDIIHQLEFLELPSVQRMINTDTLSLDTFLLQEKIALFCIIPDNCHNYHPFIGMLCAQVCQILQRNREKWCTMTSSPITVIYDASSGLNNNVSLANLILTSQGTNIGTWVTARLFRDLNRSFSNYWESVLNSCNSIIYLGSRDKENQDFIREYQSRQSSKKVLIYYDVRSNV